MGYEPSLLTIKFVLNKEGLIICKLAMGTEVCQFGEKSIVKIRMYFLDSKFIQVLDVFMKTICHFVNKGVPKIGTRRSLSDQQPRNIPVRHWDYHVNQHLLIHSYLISILWEMYKFDSLSKKYGYDDLAN